MSLAIFGISNSGLNLVASLLLMTLVVVWLALIVYTYLDAKRRLSDPFLVACATIASLVFPYVGTAIYAIVRPPEFLEDAHERELEIKAAELRVRQLVELSCPNCEYPVEKNFLRCPQCQHRLKDPCPSCGKPVDPRWALCPYCETALPQRARRQKPKAERRKDSPPPTRPAPREEQPPTREDRPAPREEKPPAKRQPAARKKAPASAAKKESARSASKEAPSPDRTQRSPAREPDADPRQA